MNFVQCADDNAYAIKSRWVWLYAVRILPWLRWWIIPLRVRQLVISIFSPLLPYSFSSLCCDFCFENDCDYVVVLFVVHDCDFDSFVLLHDLVLHERKIDPYYAHHPSLQRSSFQLDDLRTTVNTHPFVVLVPILLFLHQTLL